MRMISQRRVRLLDSMSKPVSPTATSGRRETSCATWADTEDADLLWTRNNHRYAVVVQDLATQWLQSYPWKTKTSQCWQYGTFLTPLTICSICAHQFLSDLFHRTVAYTSFSVSLTVVRQVSLSTCRQHPGDPEEPNEVPGADEEPKSHWHRQFLGIWQVITHQHNTVEKPMELQKEQCAEREKGHLRFYCSRVWVTNGGRIPWNVTAICEIFRINFLMVKHPFVSGSECPL